MQDVDLVTELDRQLAVCNACRYCEGYCATFGAAQLRTTIGSADAAYLANLCHDCRMCYDACMFTPPHVYAINIPAALSAVRVRTYERFTLPRAMAAAMCGPRGAATFALLGGVAVVLAGVLAFEGARTLVTAQHGPGAFYRVVPYAVMLGVAFALGTWALLALVLGARAFAREIGGGERFATPVSLRTALREALNLTYLKGGGAGCYDATRRSSRRRVFHALVFWGVIADFVATTSAGVEQDFLGILPPFALWSVPVASGTAGGIAVAIGAAGLLALKGRNDRRPTHARMIALDYAFLGMLEAVALTGLALLALRDTAAMPSLLAVHLGAVGGTFALAPYGKFVHFVYRSVALVKHAYERAGAGSG